MVLSTRQDRAWTRTRLDSLLPESDLRHKQLIQVLGWLWDLSVAEEHIISKAFFYFICLDIMLYSGEHGFGVYKGLGV